MSNKMRSILIKMIIVGECETGKTFLCKKLTNNHIINGYIATIGLDMYVLRKQLNNIEAKIHYPVPMYRQKAMKYLKHKIGDFPVTDFHADNLISFPIDQHITKEELDYIYEIIRKFYD